MLLPFGRLVDLVLRDPVRLDDSARLLGEREPERVVVLAAERLEDFLDDEPRQVLCARVLLQVDKQVILDELTPEALDVVVLLVKLLAQERAGAGAGLVAVPLAFEVLLHPRRLDGADGAETRARELANLLVVLAHRHQQSLQQRRQQRNVGSKHTVEHRVARTRVRVAARRSCHGNSGRRCRPRRTPLVPQELVDLRRRARRWRFFRRRLLRELPEYPVELPERGEAHGGRL